MSMTVECPACGYVRTVERDELLAGGWVGECPNCASDEPVDAGVIAEEAAACR